MRELIRSNSALLMVLSRFNIPLGFGDRTVAEVCTDSNIDTTTFLSVANLISGRKSSSTGVDLSALTVYLRRAHSYFLDFSLPGIRHKLLAALDCSGADDVAFVLLRFFDGYVSEVRTHMEYENTVVFEYIERLLVGTSGKGFSIHDFAGNHERMESKLMEFKDILVRYCPSRHPDLLNSVLFDIINCEQDIESHCEVEDRLLVPLVEQLEKDVAASCRNTSVQKASERALYTPKPDNLSTREKEIIAAIALGLSNKEVAERLCISVHTATTHRRNICAKLDIHSAAGLTIYAIVNHLVDINQIKSGGAYA